MMILRMNQHSLLTGSLRRAFVTLALVVLPCPAWAGDFACLQALIPATNHLWVATHRNQFSLPIVSPSGGAIAIAEWDHEHLTNIFVYSEKSSKRYDRMTAIGASEAQELRGLSDTWIKTHMFAIKLESFEVFQFVVEPPGGWNKKATPMRTTASEAELGGWLIEGEQPGDVVKAIQSEISLRETWVRNNNLDATRFKAWSIAEKLCRK